MGGYCCEVPHLHWAEGDEPMTRDTDISEEDVLRNAHSMVSKTRWAQTPEPNKNEGDPQVILDTDDATAGAYLWKANASSESWLSFHGEPTELKR